MSQPNEQQNEKIASAAGGIQFGDNANVGGDVFTGGKRTINTSGGSYVEGNANTGGGSFVGRDSIGGAALEPEAIARIFAPLYAVIEQRPNTDPADRGDLLAELRDLQFEAAKGDGADPELVLRRLRSLGRLAPDVLAITAAALADPAAGFSQVVAEAAQQLRPPAR